MAGKVVMTTYPPNTTDEVFVILAALNLLNAAVKQPEGKKLVSYKFIKGYASLMMTLLLRTKREGVGVYWDKDERIAYFQVYGIQLSFHYIPMTKELRELIEHGECTKICWNGYRLQEVAVELYHFAMKKTSFTFHPSPFTFHPSPLLPNALMRSPLKQNKPVSKVTPQPKKKKKKRKKKKRKKKKKKDNKKSKKLFQCSSNTLQVALTFNIDKTNAFRLYRRKDNLPLNFIVYTGSNYQQVMEAMTEQCPDIYQPPPSELKVGRLYYVSPQLHISVLHKQDRLHELAKSCYLWDEVHHKYCNLCVSYGIARYLTAKYPQLRFINTLNYNRLGIQDRYYSHRDLQRVPLRSKARMLKVWMVVDDNHVLADFKVNHLPDVLIQEYLKTEDYYQEFEFTHSKGLVGIYAYRRHHLLKPKYPKIAIRGNHAAVTRRDGRIAIYGLQDECFKTGFIYDRVWYEHASHTIYGQTGRIITIIYHLRPDLKWVIS